MIYLDYNATAPLLPEVREAMNAWWGVPANPSSVHRFGQAAAAAVEAARADVAALLGVTPDRIVFTSGATEANHLGVRALAASRAGDVVYSAVEHPSVVAAARATGRARALPVTSDGRVRWADLPDSAALIAVQAVNHETGVAQDLDRARSEAASRGAPLHVDATQAIGRVELGSDLASMAVSAHKIGGPPGVGAWAVARGWPIVPLFPGTQERGRRAGTLNTAGIVGFAAACRVVGAERSAMRVRHVALADRLRAGISALGGRVVGADPVPAVTCAVFPGAAGELVVQALDLRGVAVSHGAACASGSLDPSPVLLAMGDADPRGAVRFSFGRATSDADIEGALAALAAVLPALAGSAG